MFMLQGDVFANLFLNDFGGWPSLRRLWAWAGVLAAVGEGAGDGEEGVVGFGGADADPGAFTGEGADGDA